MTIELYSVLSKGGFVMTSYTLMKALGTDLAVLTGEITSQFNYACNHKVSDYLGFIFDLDRACKILNWEPEYLIEQMKQLQELGFINIYGIGLPDSRYIRVNEDEIIAFKEKQEMKNFSHNWDDGLLASLNPTHKKYDFSESTLRIRHYFDTHAKNPNAIPMLEYLTLDSFIGYYEKLFGNIFDCIPDIENQLEKYALNDNIRMGFIDFSSFVQDACYAAKKAHKPVVDEIPPDFAVSEGGQDE